MKGKLSFIHATYLFIGGLLVMLLGACSVVSYFIRSYYNQSISSLSLGGFILLLIGFAMIMGFLVTVPRIKIGNKQLTITKELTENIFYAFEIESIDLLMIRGDEIGCLILLTTGKEFFLADKYYKNAFQIKEEFAKQFSKHIISSINTPEAETLSNIVLPQKFSGYQLSSFNGFLFYFLITVSCLVFFKEEMNLTIISAVMTLQIFFYLLIGFQMNYFILHEDKLVIRNQLWFWYKKEYSLSNTLVVSFQIFGKDTKALTITTKRNVQKTFPASSLSKRTWLSLFDCFKKLGVPELESASKKWSLLS